MFEIRFASINEIDEIAKMRMAFIEELFPDKKQDKLTEIKNGFISFLKENIGNQYLPVFIINNNQIISASGIIVYYIPQLHDDHERKIGQILSFYTKPEFRKKGYGSMMLKFIINHAIYIKHNFVNVAEQMELILK